MKSETLARRSSLLGKVLPVPTLPFPDEGMAEMLFRASSRNGYYTMHGINKCIGLKDTSRITPSSVVDIDFDTNYLADIVGCDRDVIESKLYKKLTDKPPSASFFGTRLRTSSILSNRRVAPRSLLVGDYQRAVWALKALSFDPSSKERLLENCPVCHRTLSYVYTFGPSRCGKCAYGVRSPSGSVDLRDFPQPFVQVEDEDALDFVCSLVSLDTHERDAALRRVPGPLREFGQGEIFEIISFISRYLEASQKITSGISRASRILPPGSPELLAKAGRTVLGWPKSLPPIAEELRRYSISSQSGAKPINPLKFLAQDKFFDRRLTSLVWDEVEKSYRHQVLQSIGNSRTPETLKSHTIVSSHRAVTARGELSRLGRGVDNAGGERLSVQHSEVSLRVLLSSSQVRIQARDLGIPLPFFAECLSGNVIRCRDDTIGSLFNEGGEPPPADFYQIIKQRTQATRAPRNAISLSEAVRASTLLGQNPWPGILIAITSGDLPFWLHPTKSTGPIIRRILVVAFEAIRRICDAATSNTAPNLCLNLKEASLFTGLEPAALCCAMDVGALDRKKGLSDLTCFGRKWIGVRELRSRLCIRGELWNIKDLGNALSQTEIPCLALANGTLLRDRLSTEQYYSL